jgi:hypothetical protein
MFQLKKELKAAFAEIDGVNVVSSSWRMTKTQQSLPAIIVDYDATTPVDVAEDGTVVSKQYSFPVTAVVSLQNRTDQDAEDALEALCDSIEEKLTDVIGNSNYVIQNFFPTSGQYAKIEVLSASFQLLITL